jgi:hypothetical protein
MTTMEELLSLADDIAQSKATLLEKSIQERLDALRNACNEAARAWSGSNIGYHATVYYEGLHPPHHPRGSALNGGSSRIGQSMNPTRAGQ